MLKADSCFRCQLGKMPQPLLFDEQTYLLDCLHSYPSVGMAWCPGRSWAKLLPWALTVSNNRFRWAVWVTLHIKRLKLQFWAKHGTKLRNKCVFIHHLGLLSLQKQISPKKARILASPIYHIQVGVWLKVISLLEENIVAGAHCVTR